MGTRSVPTAEVDFVDTEAYILSSPKSDSSEGRGFNRMMSMVNGSRLGVAAMGLGIARRCFLEASIYAAHREAFGRRLDGLPLVQETLLQMAVEVEAAAAVVFEASSLAGRHGDEEARRLYRIMVPLSKFRAARRGLEVASQGLEVLGGNGYIENWPLARQFRDAQCHTIWEGAENIICLDVLRSIAKEQAHDALLGRVDEALAKAKHPALASVRGAVEGARAEAIEALTVMATLPQELQLLHARRLTGLLADLTQAALLAEQAAGRSWRATARRGRRRWPSCSCASTWRSAGCAASPATARCWSCSARSPATSGWSRRRWPRRETSSPAPRSGHRACAAARALQASGGSLSTRRQSARP